VTVSSPIRYRHAVSLYEELERRATDGQFVGSKTEAFRAIGVSQTHYSFLFSKLTEMGCIEQLQRGSQSQPTIIALRKAPTEADFETAYISRLTKPTRYDTIESRLDLLEGRLDNLESRLRGVEQIA
jgi:hypothetical protein